MSETLLPNEGSLIFSISQDPAGNVQLPELVGVVQAPRQWHTLTAPDGSSRYQVVLTITRERGNRCWAEHALNKMLLRNMCYVRQVFKTDQDEAQNAEKTNRIVNKDVISVAGFGKKWD